MVECESERNAARALGYNQASWDNLSGREQQPWSFIKRWSSLTAIEKEALAIMGYNATTWDNDSGNEPQPDAYSKDWADLTLCGGGEAHCLAYLSMRL